MEIKKNTWDFAFIRPLSAFACIVVGWYVDPQITERRPPNLLLPHILGRQVFNEGPTKSKHYYYLLVDIFSESLYFVVCTVMSSAAINHAVSQSRDHCQNDSPDGLLGERNPVAGPTKHGADGRPDRMVKEWVHSLIGVAELSSSSVTIITKSERKGNPLCGY